MYSRPNIIDIFSVYLPLFYDLPSNYFFIFSDVQKDLAKLHDVKSIGPDGLSDDLQYKLKSFLCYPFWLLFHKSLDTGVFPEYIKLNTVIPTFQTAKISNVKSQY